MSGLPKKWGAYGEGEFESQQGISLLIDREVRYGHSQLQLFVIVQPFIDIAGNSLLTQRRQDPVHGSDVLAKPTLRDAAQHVIGRHDDDLVEVLAHSLNA